MAFRRLMALALLGVVGLGVAPAVAQDDEDGWEQGPPDDGGATAPAEDDYQEALAPYGQWMNEPSYGRVWRPAVAVGWRPYVDGSWVWTTYGWTWVSSGPWAWTFHYGRWAFLPPYGWLWVPGTVWGPAWVDWYVTDGFVGWAPLPPFGVHVAVVNQFVFVHSHDFCRPYLRGAFVARDRLPHDFNRHWNDRRFFRPPGRDQIERVSRTPVVHVGDRPPETLRPRDLGRRLRPSGPHGAEARVPDRARRLDDEARRRVDDDGMRGGMNERGLRRRSDFDELRRRLDDDVARRRTVTPAAGRPDRDRPPRAVVDPAPGRAERGVRWMTPEPGSVRPDRLRPAPGGLRATGWTTPSAGGRPRAGGGERLGAQAAPSAAMRGHEHGGRGNAASAARGGAGPASAAFGGGAIAGGAR